MPRIAPLLVLALALLAPVRAAAVDRAGSPVPDKPPEVRTSLPAALSPPLSAEQLAKQRLRVSSTPAAATALTPGVKPPAFFTSLPPSPDARPVVTPAQKQLLARDAMRTPLAAARPTAAKPAELVTARPLDPTAAAAAKAALADKLAHATVHATKPAASKPRSLTTSAPATTRTPEQLNKAVPRPTPDPRRQP